MDKSIIIQKISKEAALLDDEKLKEAFDFIRFLNNRENIDPTLEILQKEEDYLSIKEGIKQKAEGKIFDWDSIKWVIV